MFGFDATPVQQMNVNWVAGMNRPARKAFHHGLSNLALAKPDETAIPRGTGLFPDPNFVKHYLGRYPSDDCPQELRQSKAQASWMKTVRNKVQTDHVRLTNGDKLLRYFHPIRPRHFASKAQFSLLSQ